MGDNDPNDPPTQRQSRPMRAPTAPSDRDDYVPKHRTDPLGVPTVNMPPIPAPSVAAINSAKISEPEQLEQAAFSIMARTKTIEKRPGPTPTASAIQTALTVASVKAEFESKMSELRSHVDTKFDGVMERMLDELSEDRKTKRKLTEATGLSEIQMKEKNWDFIRAAAWKVGALIGAVVVAILTALRILGK